MRSLAPTLGILALALALGACGGTSHNNASTTTGNRVDLTTGAGASSSKAMRAVVAYVRHRWGSSYAVHPACYGLSSTKSRCFVHLIHSSSSCTEEPTVTFKGRRTVVSMARPSC
jgi:hypothetical protein